MTQPESWLARLFRRLGQWYCGLKGHAYLLDFEGERMRLVCTACGHESAGWDCEQKPLRFVKARRKLWLLRKKRAS